MTAGAGAPVAGLALFLLLHAAQRAGELALSSRHQRALRRRGAVEHGASHFPALVALHVLFPILLTAEVLGLGARPPAAWPAWLAVLLAAQVLRIWTMAALGERWTTRIWVVPGEALVTAGPYRFLRHPNYLVVVLELLAAPMMFGAWRTAIVIGVLNGFALAVRVRAEERALAGSNPRAEAVRLPVRLGE
jgi:methyltransferase